MSHVQSVISQTVQSANSPVTLTLQTSSDTVPDTVAAYRVARAQVTDQSSAQNDVTIQSHNGTSAESEATVAVASDDSETLGAGDGDDVLLVRAGNEIRVAVEGDADVTLYLAPLR